MNEYPFVTIYGKLSCPYTSRAVNLCLEYNHSVNPIYLTTEQMAECQKKYHHYSTPVCVECYPDYEELIGGSDNLEEYLKERYEYD
jgi:glutaredoxin